MNDVQNRRILALLDMLYNTLGNKTTCNVCHKYFIHILTVMNNLTINYGTETSPELAGINYDDANALITELIFTYRIRQFKYIPMTTTTRNNDGLLMWTFI